MPVRVACWFLCGMMCIGCGKSDAISESAYETALQVTAKDDLKNVELAIEVPGVDLTGFTEERETFLILPSGEFALGTSSKRDGIGHETALVPRGLVEVPAGERVQKVRVEFRVYRGEDDERELIVEGEKEFPVQ